MDIQPTAPPETQPTPSNPPKLWDQQPDESPKAFAAFAQYLEFGPEVTLKEFAEQSNLSLEAVWKLSSRHNWRERAAAWRQHLAAASCAAVEDVITKHAALWAMRRQALQQQHYERNQKIDALCDQVLTKLLDDPDIEMAPYELARLLQIASTSNQKLFAACPLPAPEPKTDEQDPLVLEFRAALAKIEAADKTVRASETVGAEDRGEAATQSDSLSANGSTASVGEARDAVAVQSSLSASGGEGQGEVGQPTSLATRHPSLPQEGRGEVVPKS